MVFRSFFFLTGTIINFIMVFPICDLLQLHYYGIVHQWWLAASIVKEARWLAAINGGSLQAL
jgi:hypothetical protein